MIGLIISGLPASGKGTESKKVASTFNLIHLDTGEKLREEVEKESDIGKEVEKYISKGELVPDELINKVMKMLLDKQPPHQGVILDGFPRSIQQAAFLEEHPLEVRAMIYLDVKREIIQERMRKRAEEDGREDDKNPQIMRKRIDEQEAQLSEIKTFYQERNKMYHMDGNGSIEEVFHSIKGVIEKHDLLGKGGLPSGFMILHV